MKMVKAIYNFLVGDWIILSGILLVIALLAVIHFAAGLTLLRTISGWLLMVATLCVLVITLRREALGKRER